MRDEKSIKHKLHYNHAAYNYQMHNENYFMYTIRKNLKANALGTRCRRNAKQNWTPTSDTQRVKSVGG